MVIKTPSNHFFASGCAEGYSARNALDSAFLSARLGHICPIRTSSVIPPGSCVIESPDLPSGALVPMVFACLDSGVPGELISAGVAIAYPRDKTEIGVVMEYAASGHKEDIEGVARSMAEEGMRLRGLELEGLFSIAVQHKVEKNGAVMAAVVFWG